MLLDSRWRSFKDFIMCKDKSIKEKQILAIQNKLIDLENPATLFFEMGLSGTFVKNCERVWR